MKGKRVRVLPVVVLVVLAVILTATVVSALPQLQASSEDQETQMALPAPGKLDTVKGDDPDEDGYAGLTVTADSATVSPSENGSAAAAEESTFQAPGPDQAGGDKAAEASPQWTDFRYVFAAGSTFQPRDSSTQWNYAGVGCVSAAAGNEIFTLDLQLPQGARIDYLRILYYDTSPNDSQSWITNYDAQGAYTDLVNVDSAGAGGYGYAVSSYVGHIVDNQARAYVLNWRPNQTGSSMALCGLRVAYRLPTQTSFLPAVPVR